MSKSAFVYFMSNTHNNVLYVGVTNKENPDWEDLGDSIGVTGEVRRLRSIIIGLRVKPAMTDNIVFKSIFVHRLMKTKLLNKCLMLLAVLFIIQGCKKERPFVSDTIVNGQRILQFSGYSWLVESSNDLIVGPGPNQFSDSNENVWFDSDGKLHLKITQKNNKWYCAKLTLLGSPGYGKYIFYLDSRIDQLDMNVVGGLFSYKSDLEEIDIEFAKWGLAGNSNAQFSVQPSQLAGNKKAYNIILGNPQSTHWFNWQKDRVDFSSIQGHSSVLPSAGNIIQQWSYSGPNIPPLSVENIKINLWLYQGKPPSNLQEAEMVIAGFEFL